MQLEHNFVMVYSLMPLYTSIYVPNCQSIVYPSWEELCEEEPYALYAIMYIYTLGKKFMLANTNFYTHYRILFHRMCSMYVD